MTQPFTNTWDDSYPPDKSAQANQLGTYLRLLKTDTQQRMAAISGGQITPPTVPFPNFQNDALPANWNGVLYFEIPTGNVYQFQNPTFVRVPGMLGSVRFQGQLALPPVTGTTTKTLVDTIAIPAGSITVTSRVRVTLALGIQLSSVASVFGYAVEIRLTGSLSEVGSPVAQGLVDFVSGVYTGLGYLWGSSDTVNSQVWIANNTQNGSRLLGNLYLYNGGGEGTAPFRTTFLLTQPLFFQLYIWPKVVTDVYTVTTFAVEVL